MGHVFLSLKHPFTCSMKRKVPFLPGSTLCDIHPTVCLLGALSKVTSVTSQRFLGLRSLSLGELRIGNVAEKPLVSRRGLQEDRCGQMQRQSLQLKKEGSRGVKGNTQHSKWAQCVAICERHAVACVCIRLEYTHKLVNLRVNSVHVHNPQNLEQYLEENENSINAR